VSASAPGGTVSTPAQPEGHGWLLRWRTQGATVQAIVPGVYAWAVTVAPVGWGHGAPRVAAAVATLGLASLVAGPVLERRRAGLARMVAGWGLVSSSIATWVIAPEASVAAFDAARGIAGMVGWGLFAFALASPAGVLPGTATPLEGAPVRARGGRLDTPILILGLTLALALEVPGWQVGQRDRALLLRLAALLGGLGILVVAAEIASSRHPALVDAPRKKRRFPIGVIAWVVLALGLLGAGVAYGLWSEGR
jgi:hypothetical protein